jgi:hypothetical protein
VSRNNGFARERKAAYVNLCKTHQLSPKAQAT